jgi:hypothetical protein
MHKSTVLRFIKADYRQQCNRVGGFVAFFTISVTVHNFRSLARELHIPTQVGAVLERFSAYSNPHQNVCYSFYNF